MEHCVQEKLGARIVGTGSYLPPDILTNVQLQKMVNTDDEWIRTRTGIEQRHIAHKDIATSDMATVAASKAIEAAGLTEQDIGMIIVATSTPDMMLPSTACLVQKNLGIGYCPAFDMEAACTGFLYALSIAEQYVKNGLFNNILVIGAETLSRIVDWEDRNTCILFGDGAGAAIVQACEPGRGIVGSVLKADGRGSDMLSVPAGGSKMPTDSEAIDKRLNYIQMNGTDVYKFALRVAVESVREVLDKFGYTTEDIDLFVPHQANSRIIDAVTKKLKLNPEKVVLTVAKYGNMSAASIPVALDDAFRNGRVHDNNMLVLVAFGAGLSWGAMILHW